MIRTHLVPILGTVIAVRCDAARIDVGDPTPGELESARVHDPEAFSVLTKYLQVHNSDNYKRLKIGFGAEQ
jgi:hypothetical protein